MKKILKKINWKKYIKVIIFLVVIAVIAKLVIDRFNKRKNLLPEVTIETAKAEKKDIKEVLSSSGTIEPLNTYEVTSLVEGEVVLADFEEGSTVKKGDTLYKITTDSLSTKIKTAETNLKRAKKQYEKAEKNYKKAVEKYDKAEVDFNDLEIASKTAGMVTKVYVKKGDSIQQGSPIADVYDNSYMLLSVPFNGGEVKNSWIGKKAQVEVESSGEMINGIVTEISGDEKVLSGNRVVRYITIKVKNPGGITTETTATASIGTINCNSEGTFSVLEESTINADKSGKIKQINIKENNKVSNGDVVVVLSDEDVSDQLDSYANGIDSAKDSMESAQNAIEDAENNLQEQKDALADYSITAPISGQVIKKNTLVGDTIKNSANSSALCIIYDLSAVTFQMSIDELDIMNVKAGQEVTVTADALTGVKLKGVITNVSLESTTNGGVTQYPVTVKIDKTGDLLPGMNVTGKIILNQAKGAIAVPVDALMRGDVVYVKDSTVMEASGDIPAGFRSVKVETGISDGDYIQITKGLTGDEEVYTTRNMTADKDSVMIQQNGGFMMDDGTQGGASFGPGSRSSGGASRHSSEGSMGQDSGGQ